MVSKSVRKNFVLNRFILVIFIFAVVFIWTGCHRKIGVKPGEQPKTKTSKCKCKKKNALYSSYFVINPSEHILSTSRKVSQTIL